MCGITGFFKPTSSELPDRSIIEAMTKTLAHRGPDDLGVHTDAGVALGFQRLSIVDLSGGHQPLHTKDGSLSMVFNGELYNHLELREELEALGHKYQTKADSETVLHAYAAWGEKCLERFQGMFAFAIFDKHKRKLFAARDRLGIKPLHYAERGNTLIFGSEIKSLLAHPDITREVDREAAATFVTYRYLPSPTTLFRGIYKLPPGYYLTLDSSGLKTQRWWNIDFDAPMQTSLEETKEKLGALMKDSVEARLMSGVPLGALLSGGLDSSIIVKLMRDLHQGAVKTFSIGFKGSSGNEAELPYAKQMADSVGAEHHELTMAENELPQYMVPLIWNMDEPLVEPAAIPVYLISRLARETVTVVLTGEGADELLAGYPKYRMDHHAKTYGKVPSLIREQLIHRGLEAVPKPLRRVRVAERSLAIQEPFERWASWFAGFAGPGRRNILAPNLLRELHDPSGREPIAAWFEEPPNGNSLSQMLYADVKTWLADDLLMKMDRMSMATSLEARVPFLDHRLVEFAFTIPNAWKIKDRVGKWILRETFGPKLPSSILNRPKAGFPVPIDKWFRNDLKGFVESTLLSEKAASRGILDPQEVRRTVEDHVSGRRDNRREIWTLLNLELWFQVFIDPNHTPREAPEASALVS